uniref:Putative LOV domain-containing protein n=1 Tax=Rhodochaete parvula TaxID=110510 RepID=A0A126WYX5_9RHOD|nr:putative LOV domain-containing protein [Rhodochaete parvula]
MATPHPQRPKRPAITTFTDRTGTSFTPRFPLRHRDAEFFSELIHRAHNVLFVVTDPTLPDNGLVYVSPSFREHTGYDIEDILYRNCRFLQGPNTDPRDIRSIQTAVATQSEVILRLTNYRKDGTTFQNQFFLTTLRKYVPENLWRVRLRPWVANAITRLRLAHGVNVADELGEAAKVNRREKLKNVYFVGVLCDCEKAKRNVILNFGATFRSMQPPEDEHDEEHSLKWPLDGTGAGRVERPVSTRGPTEFEGVKGKYVSDDENATGRLLTF